jgi:D-glycero-D-manno-heptose 1,7-bisphosphate phosphatase
LTPPKPAVFVDRDGTIIEERSYLADPAGVNLVRGAADAIADLKRAGFAVVIVTNQSGIALGLYRESDYEAVAARLVEVLAAEGVSIDRVEHCSHHPEVTGPCGCRKPATGMHRRAAAALDLDLARSYCVGDKLTDVLPAADLGGRGILVRTGYGTEHESSVPAGVRVADDLRGAAGLILGDRLR